jgi:hypothetical protein
MDQFEIQREMITVEQKLCDIRSALSNYWGDECPEVQELNRLDKRIRRLAAKIRKDFE